MTIAELTGTVMADARVKAHAEATPEHWQQLRAAWTAVMNRLLNHPMGAALSVCPAINYRSDWTLNMDTPEHATIQPMDTREIAPVLLPQTVLLPLLRAELKANAPLWAGMAVDLAAVGNAEAILRGRNR